MHTNLKGEFVNELRNGEVYDTKQTAGYLGVTPETVRKYIDSGELEAVKRDGKWFMEKYTITQLEMKLNPIEAENLE